MFLILLKLTYGFCLIHPIFSRVKGNIDFSASSGLGFENAQSKIKLTCSWVNVLPKSLGSIGPKTVKKTISWT